MDEQINNSLMEIEQVRQELENKGIIILSDSKRLNSVSSCANTYIFSTKDNHYILDPGFGKKRRTLVGEKTFQQENPTILCSHYHNDHCANMGVVGSKKSRILCHNSMEEKISFLRTNGVGQILSMIDQMPVESTLKRFKMFPPWLVSMLSFLSGISMVFPKAFMFLVSYLYSIKNIGFIYPGKKRIEYLDFSKENQSDLKSGLVKTIKIDDELTAFETLGHTDDHISFYHSGKKALFTGDALNFLNANDIQYGDIEKLEKTISFLIELVEEKDIEILLQGHFYPVFGKENIKNHLLEIKEKHEEVSMIAKEIVYSFHENFSFDEALEKFMGHPSKTIAKIAKINFPRSTLIFMEVYLLKRIKDLGFHKDSKGLYKVKS